MNLEKAIEIIDEEHERLLSKQKEYLRQFNWHRRTAMDWREIENVEHTIRMLKYISACVDATERVKELLEFEIEREQNNAT